MNSDKKDGRDKANGGCLGSLGRRRTLTNERKQRRVRL